MGSGREILHLRNPGMEKHYTLQLMKSSNRFESSGTFDGLDFAEGSSQSIRVGSSDSLATTRIELLVDTDSDGSTDEVIVLRGDAATAVDRPAVISDDLHAWPVPWHPDEGPLSIRYSLRRESTARLIVYNTLQQVVAELVPAQRHYAGSAYTATWNGRDAAGTPVPSGTYFYVLEAASGSRAVGKVAVLR
jgi:hypothetical protein